MLENTNIHKVIIIGSGPAGYSAAIYTARANLSPVLINGNQPGGQLTITTEVENYPGFADPIQGPWLMEQMEKQATNVGTKIIHDHISKVNLTQKPFELTGESGNKYLTQSLIISTGAQAKWLGIESEKKFQGFGVSGCATCDGFFFKNKKVIVVGGGNSAVEEALYLTNHASEVIVLHRKKQFKAEKILQDRLFANSKIRVIWDSVLLEVLGNEKPKGVTGVKIQNIITQQTSEISLDGVFVAIGHKPNSAIFKEAGVNVDEEGYIITKPNSTATNIAGVYASGDIQDKIYRQAITAAGTGCMAALEVEKFLSH
jgi:thioredoxin reductase (NADPH)